MNTTYLSCVLFFGTCCWTPTDNIGGGGGGGVFDCILCLQCNRCLKIVIDYEHYLFIMRSFFLALAVGLPLITWDGGDDWLHPMFPFLSPVNSFLHLFATFCSDFATF